jgi:hypothetical protein
MLRETIQTLACLCVLTSTYSLHMSRDSYRNPPSLTNIDLNDFNENDEQLEISPIATLSLEASPQTTSINNKNSIIFNNELDDGDLQDWNHLAHPVGPLHHQPRGLQDLFGVVVTNYDIKSQQKHLKVEKLKQQPTSTQEQSPAQLKEQHQNNKRASTSGNSGAGPGGGSSGSNSGSSSSMPNLPTIPHGMASQLMLRSARGQRQYDVPQIGKFLMSHYSFLYLW